MQFGQRGYNPPSRFLEDMGSSAMMTARQDMPDELYESQQMTLDINDRVRSAQFGDGTVIDIDGMAITVAFDSGQMKKLNVEYARLQLL